MVVFQPLLQKALLEVFFDVFQIRIPEWTECFIQVLKSVGKCISIVTCMSCVLARVYNGEGSPLYTFGISSDLYVMCISSDLCVM